METSEYIVNDHEGLDGDLFLYLHAHCGCNLGPKYSYCLTHLDWHKCDYMANPMSLLSSWTLVYKERKDVTSDSITMNC